jgi:hypothetical protein
VLPQFCGSKVGQNIPGGHFSSPCEGFPWRSATASLPHCTKICYIVRRYYNGRWTSTKVTLTGMCIVKRYMCRCNRCFELSTRFTERRPAKLRRPTGG